MRYGDTRDRAGTGPLPADAQLLALSRRRAVLLDAWNAPGPDLDDQALDVFGGQLDDIDLAIAETHAESLAGLRAKARVVEVLIREAGGAFYGAQQSVAESLIDDIERLAAEADAAQRGAEP